MDHLSAKLWDLNTPAMFWQCRDVSSPLPWEEAVENALPALGLGRAVTALETALALTLGEARFGERHWQLGPATRAYYILKPVIPRRLGIWLRRVSSPGKLRRGTWPIEATYVNFLWEAMRQLLMLRGSGTVRIRSFWPEGLRYALVLTHDVETDAGQEYVRQVVDLEETLGFRSSFNFVPERYTVDRGLLRELKERGFEVGVHGLKHDGRLFGSQATFRDCAARINAYLKDWGATGFRSELTLRQPEWMQELEIEYDLSFFDTDPFEPIPGGSMSIWPYFIGRFTELPYTLAQDHTLTSILGERSPRIWLDKVDFIRQYHGMALVNTHPDYLRDSRNWDVYSAFLEAMKKRGGYWHALPSELADWWRRRSSAQPEMDFPGLSLGQVRLCGAGIEVTP